MALDRPWIAEFIMDGQSNGADGTTCQPAQARGCNKTARRTGQPGHDCEVTPAMPRKLPSVLMPKNGSYGQAEKC